MAHYYNKDGESRYQVKTADGKKWRDTTIRDAKKNNWVPSVTTIMKLLDKPAVTWWKLQKLQEVAWSVPNVEMDDTLSGFDLVDDQTGLIEINYYEWSEEVYNNYKVETSKASDMGTKIHDALEEYIKTGKAKRGYTKYCRAVQKELDSLGVHEWIAEEGFCHPLGFGGKVDCHTSYEKQVNCVVCEGRGELTITSTFTKGSYCDGYYTAIQDCAACSGSGKDSVMKYIIIDFKTKPQIAKAAVYDEHIMQLAAYGEGLSKHISYCDKQIKCYNLFVSYDEEDGEIKTKFVEHAREDINTAWRMFKLLNEFWQLKNRYVPNV